MSRRMRGRGAALLAVLLAALLALTACQEEPDVQPGPAPGGEEAGPLTLTVRTGGAQDTLDPAFVTAQGGETILYHLYENLMRWTDGGDGWAVLSPGQAESYTVETDYAGNATYTFTLREDILWSDGRAVTAEDFAASWRRLADPAAGSPHRELMAAVAGYSQVQSTGDTSLLEVSAPDARTFVVTLNGSRAYFLEELCGGAYTMPVRTDLPADGATVTNGPYTATHLSRNLVTLERSGTYYGGSDGPEVLHFATREGAEADYAAFQSGELALVTGLPAEALAERAAGGLWTPEPETVVYGVLLNTQQPPFDDPNVRQAFRLAVDPQAVAEQAGDLTARAAVGLVPYGVSDYGEHAQPQESEPESEPALPDPNAVPDQPESAPEPDPTCWDFRTHSLEKVTVSAGRDYAADCLRAQALMAQAGYAGGGGFPLVEYLYVDSERGEAVARILQSMWQECLGVTVTVRGVSQAEYDAALVPAAQDEEGGEGGTGQTEAQPQTTGTFFLAAQEFTVPYSDAGPLLWRWYGSGKGNICGYRSDAFDILLDSARAAVSPDARDAYLHDAEAILLEDAPVIPVLSLGGSYQLAGNLSGLYRAPDGVYFLCDIRREVPQE